MIPENMAARTQQYETIAHIANVLDRLGGAFHRTGNAPIGAELRDIAQELFDAILVMRGIDSKDLDDVIRQTREASENLLNACLAGVKIATEQK